MAGLMIRRTNPEMSTISNPYQWARDLLSTWDPFRELETFPAFESTAAMVPPFEVRETSEAFVFKADVPGVKETDLEITLTGNRLVVSGRREMEKEEKNQTYYARERSFGTFTRSFTLPDGTDPQHVRAELKDGVLTLMLPKMPAMQPKRIEIKAEKIKA